MSQPGHRQLEHLPLGRIRQRVLSQFWLGFAGPWIALMTVTFGVYLGTRPLTVSGHTARGRLTSSGIGWAASCMIMATVVIVTWRSLFRSVVHSQIAPCHQACTSHVLLAHHKRMSPAVPWHPLLTGSLAMREWALLTMTQELLPVSSSSSSSSSSGGGRPGYMTMVVRSQGEQKMWKRIFAGAVFESGSAPLFNFNGNFNLFWMNILRNVSLLFFYSFFQSIYLRCLTFTTLPGMNDNSDNWNIAMQ